MIDKQENLEKLIAYINGGYASLKVRALVEQSLDDDRDFKSMMDLMRNFEGDVIADEYDNAIFAQKYETVYYADKLVGCPNIKRFSFTLGYNKVNEIIEKHFTNDLKYGRIIVLADDDDYEQSILDMSFHSFNYVAATENSVFHSCYSILIQTCKIAPCKIYFTLPKELYKVMINK